MDKSTNFKILDNKDILRKANIIITMKVFIGTFHVFTTEAQN